MDYLPPPIRVPFPFFKGVNRSPSHGDRTPRNEIVLPSCDSRACFPKPSSPLFSRVSHTFCVTRFLRLPRNSPLSGERRPFVMKTFFFYGDFSLF